MTPYFVKMAAFVFPSWSANWKGYVDEILEEPVDGIQTNLLE